MASLALKSKASGKIKSHVVFVHGLGGDPEHNWVTPKGVFWPVWLSKDIEGTAVWTVDYHAPRTNWLGQVMGLQDRAENILALLSSKPELQNGSIHFVTHSLGGLVLKQSLRVAERRCKSEVPVQKFLERCRSVVFLGTPHSGADAPIWILKLGAIIRPSQLTRTLVRNDPALRELNHWYRVFSKDRKLENLSIVETKTTSIFGMIVKADSSDPGLESVPIPVDADHFEIARPSDKSAEVYVHIRKFIAASGIRASATATGRSDPTAVLPNYEATIHERVLAVSQADSGISRIYGAAYQAAITAVDAACRAEVIASSVRASLGSELALARVEAGNNGKAFGRLKQRKGEGEKGCIIYNSGDAYFGELVGMHAGGLGEWEIHAISNQVTPEIVSRYQGEIAADSFGRYGLYLFANRTHFVGEWSSGKPRFGYRNFSSEKYGYVYYFGDFSEKDTKDGKLWVPHGDGVAISKSASMVYLAKLSYGEMSSVVSMYKI